MASISLPTLAYIGIASAAVGAIGAGVSAYQSHEAGVAASNQAKQKARIAADSATQQQITQRQNLLRSLASQNAAAGAGGITTGGSFKANAMRQITENQNDLLVTQAGASATVNALNQQADNARSSGDLGAGASLLDAAQKGAAGYANYEQASKKLG